MIKYKLIIEGTKKGIESIKEGRDIRFMVMKESKELLTGSGYSLYSSFRQYPHYIKGDEIEFIELPEPKKVYKYKTLKELVEEFGGEVKIDADDGKAYVIIRGWSLGCDKLGAVFTVVPYTDSDYGKIFIKEEDSE